MLLVVLLLSCIVLSNSDVAIRVTTETSTQLSHSAKNISNSPTNSDSQVIDKEDSSVKQDGSNRIYLDDVLFALHNHNWTKEEELCLNQTMLLLHSLQNFTLWAVWQWDSQSSQPQGLLFGNRYQLGNFDECMNAPWAKSYHGLRTKYCLAEIQLVRADQAVRKRPYQRFYPYQSALDFIEYTPRHSPSLNQLTWGACAPSVCSSNTIERLLGIMLARSHLGAAGMRANISISESCQTYDDQEDYDVLFYAFFIITGILILICLVCTYLNSKNADSDTLGTKIIQAFCLQQNAKDLLVMQKSGLEVFYGIRFLAICLIVLDHQIGISNSGPISDRFFLEQDHQNPLWLLLLHNDLFVDSFFLLSGFLTVTHITKLKKLPNPLILIIKRYIRLVVALGVVVFYLAAVYRYTGSGPLWNRAIAGDTVQCRKNWWLNLLMVQNYVDVENICILISWYIPCDFHFFVVTVLLYWLYRRQPTLGLVCAACLTISAIILPGLITYIYELPPVLLFTVKFVSNPRIGAGATFPMTYVPSHTRYAAYLVGCFCGYFYASRPIADNMSKLSKKWPIVGSAVALVIMLAVMMSGSTYLWRSYSALEGALYASLNRPVWASAVALLVCCCSFGHVPIIKGFLSWYPWVPLSRLSYGLYLTHAVIITRNVYVTRNPQHNDYFEILNATAGTIFWGCVAAFLIWLLAEAPANKLFVLCLQHKARQKEETTSEPRITSTEPDTGHLQGNISSTSYLSKI